MKLKWGALLIFCLLSASVVLYWRHSQSRSGEIQQTPHLTASLPHYFISVPVVAFSHINMPILTLQIEDKQLPIGLDLGFRGDLSLSAEVLNELTNKSYRGSKTMWNFRGDSYEAKLYDIPKINLGKLRLSGLITKETHSAFHQRTTFSNPNAPPPTDLVGFVGWELFRASNLFLDLANAEIAFCDGLSSLNERGYLPEEFVQTPLLTDRGLVECHALTTKGLLRYALDTGCTWNIFHQENPQNLPLEKMIKDPDSSVTFPTFTISGRNLGPIDFVQLPINLPIPIDGVLGMEFFLEFAVFIDFANQQIYFAPAKKR